MIICCFERTNKGRWSTQPAFSWFPGPNCARATSPILLQPYTAVPSHCNFSNVKQFLKAISKSICPHNLSFTPKNISKTKQTMHICIKYNQRIWLKRLFILHEGIITPKAWLLFQVENSWRRIVQLAFTLHSFFVESQKILYRCKIRSNWFQVDFKCNTGMKMVNLKV